jgi:hypothetical protein
MLQAARVVESAHEDSRLSIEGTKVTQSLYLPQHDEAGEVGYKIPFFQRARLMTCPQMDPTGVDERSLTNKLRTTWTLIVSLMTKERGGFCRWQLQVWDSRSSHSTENASYVYRANHVWKRRACIVHGLPGRRRSWQ